MRLAGLQNSLYFIFYETMQALVTLNATEYRICLVDRRWSACVLVFPCPTPEGVQRTQLCENIIRNGQRRNAVEERLTQVANECKQ